MADFHVEDDELYAAPVRGQTAQPQTYDHDLGLLTSDEEIDAVIAERDWERDFITTPNHLQLIIDSALECSPETDCTYITNNTACFMTDVVITLSIFAVTPRDMIPHMTPADPIPDVLPDTCLLAALIQCLSANICDYSEDEAVEQFPMGVRSVIRCLLTISDDPELRHLFPDRIFIMIRILWNELAPRLTGPRRYMFKASVPQYILK